MESHSPIKICRAIQKMSTQAHGNFLRNCAVNYVLENSGSNAATLKVQIDDEFAKIDFILTVFDGGIATAYPITQNNFVSPCGPRGVEEIILSFFVPRAILALNHMAISAMMHRAGKIRIGNRRRSLGYFHQRL